LFTAQYSTARPATQPKYNTAAFVFSLSFRYTKTIVMKKMITVAALLQLAFLFTFSFQSHSQSLSSADIKAQMVKDWERAKAYTVDYLNTMPANKYSFKAVDSLRSFAMQMLHLATGNVLLMSNATGNQPLPWLIIDIEHRPSAQQKIL